MVTLVKGHSICILDFLYVVKRRGTQLVKELSTKFDVLLEPFRAGHKHFSKLGFSDPTIKSNVIVSIQITNVCTVFVTLWEYLKRSTLKKRLGIY